MAQLTLLRQGSPLSCAENQLKVLNGVDGQHPSFDDALREQSLFPLRASGVEVLQINLGKLCNQTCRHCHVDAGPERRGSCAGRRSRSTGRGGCTIATSTRCSISDWPRGCRGTSATSISTGWRRGASSPAATASDARQAPDRPAKAPCYRPPASPPWCARAQAPRYLATRSFLLQAGIHSIQDVIAQRDADGNTTPLFFVRVGSETYYRKGAHRPAHASRSPSSSSGAACFSAARATRVMTTVTTNVASNPSAKKTFCAVPPW